jgi:hypothetical protein
LREAQGNGLVARHQERADDRTGVGGGHRGLAEVDNASGMVCAMATVNADPDSFYARGGLVVRVVPANSVLAARNE